MKRTVEINDTLDETVKSACDSVKDEALSYLDSNGDEDTDEAPDLNDLDDRGAIHEIIDGATPIYNGEIRDLWYLYASDFEAALDNAGMETTADNRQQIAIFCYLEQTVLGWYEGEKGAIFDEWREKNPIPEDEDDEEEEDEEEDKPAK